jgi:predicted nuclease with RNAse H fold
MLKSVTWKLARRATQTNRSVAVRAFAAAAPTWTQAGEKPPVRQFESAHVDERVPDSDYYKGHLMADHLEYIDDVLEKTIELEDNLTKLQENYEKKEQARTNVGWVTSAEMDELFQDSKTRKEKMKQQLAEIQALLKTAKKTYAVDAPDGTCDDCVMHERQEIDHIIEDAALHEDKEAVKQLHAQDEANRRVLGVDAPDGTSDAIFKEDLSAVEHILEDAHDKDEILKQRKLDIENRKVIGVDAPDGTSDDLFKEEILEAQHIIDDAHDREEVLAQRQLDMENRKVLGVDAPDGMSDAVELENRRVVQSFIDPKHASQL